MATLDTQILKDVSRSFYLSMRVLPKPMRAPISLGYLLARASDTLADTVSLAPTLRLEMLDGMAEVLENSNKRGEWLERLTREVIPSQEHAGEIVLLKNMGGVLDWLDGVSSSEQRESILRVLKHILRGQRLDIERFELQEGFLFSEDSQLEEYCYLVAGCVGEFWSEVGVGELTRFSSEKLPQLKSWGANYGKALQLINILRDLPNDLQAGRCYLPHVDPNDRDALLVEVARWQEVARAYLKDGERYAQSLYGRRTRMATALPGKIGTLTLDLMADADWETLSRGVKVTRKEVYRCAWQAFWA